MTTICETIMLICFGLSWPSSVLKSYRSRTAKGKSIVFQIAIILGYIAGISGKILSGNFSYVFYLYVINLCMVCTDLMLYFRNRKLDMENDMAMGCGNVA